MLTLHATHCAQCGNYVRNKPQPVEMIAINMTEPGVVDSACTTVTDNSCELHCFVFFCIVKEWSGPRFDCTPVNVDL